MRHRTAHCALHRGPLATCALLVMPALAGAGCEAFAPPPPPPPDPIPAYALSQPFPDIRSLNDIDVLSPALAYSVGTDGAVLRRTDGVWSREESGVDVELLSVAGVFDPTAQLPDAPPPEIVVAVGANGTVLQRSAGPDGVWSALTTDTTELLFAVALRSPTDGFIVGDHGIVFRWDGTGVTRQVNQVLQARDVVDADGNPGIEYFPLPETLKGVGFDGATAVAVGSRGAFYTFDADGDPNAGRWTKVDSTTSRPLASVFSSGGLTLVPTMDGVLLSQGPAWCDPNRPADWCDKFRTPAPVFLQDVWALNGNDVFAVGLSDDLYQWDGAWHLVQIAEAAQLRAVDGIDGVAPLEEGGPTLREITAVGGGGRIVRGPQALPATDEVQLFPRDPAAQ